VNNNKIKMLVELANKKNIPIKKVITPVDRLMLKCGFDVTPVLYWQKSTIMVVFGILSIVAKFLNDFVSNRPFMLSGFLQYGLLGLGIGFVLFHIFILPVKNKLMKKVASK
jgi:hypothetical protein